jgi:hypothetical protein
MKYVRRTLAAALIAVLAMAVAAGPAGARHSKQPKPPKQSFTYFAVIDCGWGPIDVGSGDDLWSPLVDLKTGRKFNPVAWNVSGDGFAIDETKPGESKRRSLECSYSDGVATGTVNVIIKRR